MFFRNQRIRPFRLSDMSQYQRLLKEHARNEWEFKMKMFLNSLVMTASHEPEPVPNYQNEDEWWSKAPGHSSTFITYRFGRAARVTEFAESDQDDDEDDDDEEKETKYFSPQDDDKDDGRKYLAVDFRVTRAQIAESQTTEDQDEADERPGYEGCQIELEDEECDEKHQHDTRNPEADFSGPLQCSALISLLNML